MKRTCITLILSLLMLLPASQKLETIMVEYFGDIGCSHCDLFEEKILPAAEQRAGFEAEVTYVNVLTQNGFELCEKRLAVMGYEYTISPVMIVGNNVYQGNSAVDNGILEELLYARDHGEYLPKRENLPGIHTGSQIDIAVLPVLLAGLIDGVNPCAFATMIFFISWIALRGGSRKGIIIAGTGFITGVFIAYLIIGLGFFAVFQAAQDLSLLREIIRYLFSSVSLILSILTFRDAYRIWKSKEAGAMQLQLPKTLKKRIHRVIRNSDMHRGPILLFSVLLVTGLIVALLELACTGQIYFPTIAYMVQSGSYTGALLWLVLYNIAFVLPLILLFTFALAGVSHKKISSWFNRHVVKGKLATGILFLLLAMVIWAGG